MSSLFVKVCRFDRMDHPHADSLFVALPHGTNWRCCVRKDQFENEDLGIYIPVDSQLPAELAEALGLPNVVPGEPYRVRTIRLRSLLSQGLLLPNQGRFTEGQDVAAELGITKYVVPEPLGADLRVFPEAFKAYTDIENFNNFPNVFVEGEEVIFTEKIDGATFRAGWVNGEFYCGSAKTAFKPDANSHWNAVAVKYNLQDKLKPYPNRIVYGELFGCTGLTKLKYGLSCAELRIFDIYEPDRFFNRHEFVIASAQLDLITVPRLYHGPFLKELMLEYSQGKSTLNEGHIREGLVCKPRVERWDFDNGLGRVVLKSVNPDFLLKHWD